MDPELLRRPLSSSARLYHQPWPRALRSELDRRRARCRTRTRPRASFPSLRREWVVHCQWEDVLLVEGCGALEGA